MQPFLPDFAAILRTLDTGNVQFVLIGGLAMLVHGSDHLTQDIDICYAPDSVNLESLVTALQSHQPRLRGVPADLPFIFDAKTFRNAQNPTLDTTLGAIDLLDMPSGIASFDGLWERSVVIELYDVSVHVASLDDLIAMKRAANRPKDQMHLLELEQLKRLTQEEYAI